MEQDKVITNPRWTYGQSIWELIRKVHAKELEEDPELHKELEKKYETQLTWEPKLLGLVIEMPPLVAERHKMDDSGMLKALVAHEYLKMKERDRQNPLGIYISEPWKSDLGMIGEHYVFFEKDFIPYENSTFEAGLLKYYLAMKKANEEPIPEYYEEPF